MGESLLSIEPTPAKHRDFLVGGEQTDRRPDTGTLRHSKERPIPAANVHQVIAGAKLDRPGNAFMNEPGYFLLVPAAKRQIVRVSGVPRSLAAIFHVIVGA